jgi:type II secretory pathway pseudopilin PulG
MRLQIQPFRISKVSAQLARRNQSAFTMVEIALCLGIIAFALVAIMGVLPSGLKVQKENREETIINQDGMFLLEAIRGGAKGLDDLTNYVESITITYKPAQSITFTNDVKAANRLTNGLQIVGLLSTPRIEMLPNGRERTNLVEAYVRSISGVAGDQSRINNEMAFRYLVRPEIVPFTAHPFAVGTGTTLPTAYRTNIHYNLHEVRLLVRWPLFERGGKWDTGRGRKVFRTLISGELQQVQPRNQPYYLYWFDPNTFTTNQFAIRL